MDCSPFLNWNEKELESEDEWAIVFRSLVATLKFQPALAVSLETKAVTFLKSVSPASQSSPDDFLNSLGRATDESPTAFVQSLVVLLSSASQVITTASMELLSNLFWPYSPKLHLSLIKADLIPQIIIALNPHSLSFAETLSIHINLMKTIRWFMWLVTPYPLAELGVQDLNEQQAVRETILQQVVVPSEKYIRHLCVKRFSIVDRQLSEDFMYLLCRLLEISPYYQPTMEVVLNMPVFLTIPSCLTFFEDERTIWYFLVHMNYSQGEWNRTRGNVREMWKTVERMLRMEGMEDVIEEKLQNDKYGHYGILTVANTIILKNLQGITLPRHE